MSFVMNRRKRVRKLVAVALATLVPAVGCSNSDVSGAPSAFAEFAVDFAREAFVAWLL